MLNFYRLEKAYCNLCGHDGFGIRFHGEDQMKSMKVTVCAQCAEQLIKGLNIHLDKASDEAFLKIVETIAEEEELHKHRIRQQSFE